jgi:hypothetical protein
MKIYKLLLILIAGTFVISCEDYLDEHPSKTSALVPETVEHLETLLNNYLVLAPENPNEIIYGTDDYGLITDLYDARNSIYTPNSVQYAAWNTENLESINSIYWPQEWKKIFVANLILSTVDEVSGDAEKKKELKAEAHFLRVYSYFNLANVFTLPYTEANKNELGLPIKQNTVFEESVKRATLGATWEFMEADLEMALELSTALSQKNNLNRTWRASSAAVKAFAARFYLALHDYEKAQQYAEQALVAHSALVNYNTEMSYYPAPWPVTIFNPGPETVELRFPSTLLSQYQVNPSDHLAWKESYYFRFFILQDWYYIPSQELLDLYNTEYDLRYQHHMVENYSYFRGATNPPYSHPGYLHFFFSDILSGPSVAEMILIKAETQIRQGSWAEGIQTVNTLRQVRMDASAPAEIINLSATSPEGALKVVLEERRREMPFITRWYDVRRFNNNNDSSDDVIMTRTFYSYTLNNIFGGQSPVEYTLEKNSRRFANPLPINDIISSGGVLEQNEY